MKSRLTRYKKFILILLLGSVSIAGTSFVDSYFEVSKNLDIFATLFKEINIYYVDETKPDALMKKGIDAMLESLDPYTTFIPESEIDDYRYMTTGQYGGIGSLIRKKGEYILIAEPYEGYPAHKAGLKAGDAILEIDGEPVIGKTTDDLSKALKGKPNTKVTLKIKRDNVAEPLKIDLEREEIKVKSVSYVGMLDNNIGYINLSGFTQNAGKEVKEAILELKKDDQLKGIILDLRNNPGGLLTESIKIVNHFVEKGQVIVSTKGKIEEWNKSYKAINNPVDTVVPLVVLVNKSSASASEIVSGSLQDLDRAVILGQRTYGKGLVQTTRNLSYNTKLKVTTAKYFIPSGRCIQALDYYNRKTDGTVERFADSLKNEFKTKCGRTVFDGGGISPDIEVESITIAPITQSLITRNFIFDFATQYAQKHNKISDPSIFRFSEDDYNEFLAFIKDKEYDYKTKTESLLEEFEKTSDNEKYFPLIKDDFENLKKKVMHNKAGDIETHKKEIIRVLSAEIVSRYYYQKGRIRVNLSTDPIIAKASSILSSTEKYKSILAGEHFSPSGKN